MAAKLVWLRNKWYLRDDQNGKRLVRSLKTTDKAKAQRIIDAYERKRRAKRKGGMDLDPAGLLPLDQAIEDWYTSYSDTFAESTRGTYKNIVYNHLVPFFGSLDMRALNDARIIEFASQKVNKENLSPSIVDNCITVLRRVINVAIEIGLLESNPVPKMRAAAKKVTNTVIEEVAEIEAWTAEEVVTILNITKAKQPFLYPLMLFLFQTGCRRGEALGLQWRDVDFRRGKIKIRRSKVIGENRTKTPKSGKARTVPLHPILAAALGHLLAQQKKAGPWDTRCQVFLSPMGLAWDEHNLAKRWRHIRSAAQDVGVRPLRMHDTRHTFATHALESGKSIKWVQEVLGHAKPETTLGIYAHVLQGLDESMEFASYGLTSTNVNTTSTLSKTVS